MDGMGLLIFLLLGLPTPALAALKAYNFVDQLKNWAEAQTYCRENFIDLATIDSAEDLAKMNDILANSGQSDAWIGLYDDVKSWKWSLDNSSLDQTQLGSWFHFIEDNADGIEHCVDIYTDGELDDYDCAYEQWSLCYDESTNSYIPVTEYTSWQYAQSYCRETYTDLASIRNQQEFNDIVSVLHSEEYYWIGLHRESWKWSDESASSFRGWASDQPLGDGRTCVATGVGGWYDDECSKTHPFICSTSVSVRPSMVLKVTLKTDGSVDLNDPRVQEAIVKQMDKDLKGQGVNQGLRLSWKMQPNGNVFNKTEL